MPYHRDYLDELFVDKLGYEPAFQTLTKPSIDSADNLLNLSRDYVAPTGNVAVIVAECKDRLPHFQKSLIKEYKRTYPDAHFLFISNKGKVFDLYNYATSKKFRPISYNEIERNTKLFKEKIQFFNANTVNGSADLKVQIEKAFETTDKITKKFYDNFKGIHEKLTKAIKGIKDEGDRKWYATTLLNRIMFIFFLQKNYVLQGDTDYLLTKFDQVKWKGGNYYKDFLLQLFFNGFAKKDNEPEKKAFIKEFGEVKYLNGGLFYPNKVEMKYASEKQERVGGRLVRMRNGANPEIDISNNVLHEVLKFLNGYAWYLDNRPLKNEKEVNPDVLGYIFERYVNYKEAGQKELGAYYTKEDITEYISKNTIIPFIFDKLRRNGFDAPDPTPLITNNEDIIAIADNFIINCDNYETLKFLYKDILQPLNVLDPAVGSGAFLFAALNILLPIYQATIARLKTFKDKENDSWVKNLLSNLSGHPEEYYLTKQIILNNLYGVDIVEEGVEICKLRLFLQLASHLADITSIEPLPDIDFNIYSGNSLVGGLSWNDLLGNYGLKLFTRDGDAFTQEELLQLISDLKDAKKKYKQLQSDEDDEKKLRQQKTEVQRLENRINQCIDIGIENPFHWFVEYADIFEHKGFDVIIGNPPYVEYNTTKNLQNLRNFSTLKCGNLYAYFIERSKKITHPLSRIGFIIPMPSINTNRMEPLQQIFRNSLSWISSYDERPSSLFEGVDQRLSIVLMANHCETYKQYTTGIIRWYSQERENLFKSSIGKYILSDRKVELSSRILKFKSENEYSIFDKLQKHQPIEFLQSNTITDNIISYRSAGGRYWKIFINKEFPTQSLSNVIMYLKKNIKSEVLVAVLNSSLFWWYYSLNFDMYNLKNYMVNGFRFNYPGKDLESVLTKLGKRLMNDIEKNAEVSVTNHKTRGQVETVLYKIIKSKPILDEVDIVLADYYGFTKKEVEFIINYDIRFRMGGDND